MTSHVARCKAPRVLLLGLSLGLVFFGSLMVCATARGAPLIVNEYNAVAANNYLIAPNYRDGVPPAENEVKEDTYFNWYLDSHDDGLLNGSNNGRIEGNGGNWVELLVVQDHLNVQGWQLWWAETDNRDGRADGANGSDIWYGDGDVEQGIVTFSSTAAIWTDLRAGTLITISEKDAIYVDVDWDGGNDDRNFTDGLDQNDPEVDITIDLSTDTGYDPLGDDWWIHVSSRQEHDSGALLVSTVTNVTGDDPGDFSVGPDRWQVTVVDNNGDHVYGPVGEDATVPAHLAAEWPAAVGWGGGGVNDEEAGRLELPPHEGEDPHGHWPPLPWGAEDWATASNAGYDDATSTSFGQPNAWGTPEEAQKLSALRGQVPEPGTSVLLLIGGISSLLAYLRRKRPARSS